MVDINSSEGIDKNILRYSRQIILDGFGTEGQRKLESSKVLVVGAGGLGSPCLMYLASAGVGHIGIIDFDLVDYSNLNRQILHFSSDIGVSKLESAKKKLNSLNSNVQVDTYKTRLTADNAEEIISEYDLVVDCTDNFTARYLISDCCFFLGKPLVEGACVGYDGILMTIIPGSTPCYRCLYPKPPEDGVLQTCSDTGILGAVAGIMGSMQALEAIKVIAGIGETVSGRVMVFDGLTTSFREIKWTRKAGCPLCGENPIIKELVEYDIKCKLKNIL